MKVNYAGTTQQIDICNVFKNATKDDYVDLVEAFGIKLHISDFDNSTFMIVYDDVEDVVSVEITNGDDYESIEETDFEMTPEERKVIVDNLTVAD